MTPQGEIDRLDRQLSGNAGETVTLQRKTGAATDEVDVRAFARDFRPTALIQGNGVMQGDSLVTISPTQINAAGWPAHAVAGPTDPRIPMLNDGIKIGGRWRKVMSAVGIRMNGILVRINLQVR